MRPLRSLLLYLAWILLAGATVAPWACHAAHWGAEHFPALDHLAQQPFHRFVHRSMLFMALVGLWPFLKAIGANSWQAVGLPKPAGNGRWLGAGFLAGFGSLACVAFLAVVGGARMWDGDPTLAGLLGHAASAAVTAAVVALLEELLFRGALFGSLRRTHDWLTALLVSSTVYSMVHFFEKPPPPDSVTLGSGFVTLAQMFRGFGQWDRLVPGFIALLLAGAILCLAFLRTGTLYFSIGLHAGWIFWLKSYGHWTTRSPDASTWWWGTGRLVDGWLATIVLSLVFLVVWAKLPKRESTADDS